MAKKEKPAELEINSKEELGKKLTEAIENTDNKPTDEEVEEAKKKFEKESKNFNVNAAVPQGMPKNNKKAIGIGSPLNHSINFSISIIFSCTNIKLKVKLLIFKLILVTFV